MEFLKILPLRGPNIWTYRPVIEVWLDIGELEDSPSNTIPGFYERLSSWMPTLIEHRCGVGERGGFFQRLREGTWPGHILEHVTLELQNLAGMQSGFGKARGTSQRGVYKVVVRSRNEQVTRAALQAGRELVLAAMQDTPYDVAATVAQLRELVDRQCLGPSTACIVEAATARNIPAIRLTEGNLVQFGYGARQKRIWTAETEQTSAIAEGISRDKDLTKTLLAACGVPVPEGEVVTTPAEAWETAKKIGLPVVVKPSDANHGRGVSTELMTQAEVEAAFHLADAEGSEVLVERYIRGNEHRLLVVANHLVAAARGETISLQADGHSTIRELVAQQLNSDSRRGEGEEFPLDVIRVDQDAVVKFELTRQGYTADSVPTAGVSVLIQRNGNVAIDVTDAVHPEVAAAATLAARVVGLDIAGIDMVAEDISRPLVEQDAAIVEVNAGPSLLMHLKPAIGQARPVGEAILASLFTPGENGRIPIVGISGSCGTTLTARIVARLLQLQQAAVGLACADGLFLGQRQLATGNAADWASAQKLLLNRGVEAAVIEQGGDSILSEGLGYDRCQVGVLTNIVPALHTGRFYIETDEQVCNVLRTQVDVVLAEGVAVLNATDALTVTMAEYADGEVMYFSHEADNAVLATHRQQGGRAVVLKEDAIWLAEGTSESELLGLGMLPLLQQLRDPQALECVLAAVAAAWASGMSPALIRGGIAAYVH